MLTYPGSQNIAADSVDHEETSSSKSAEVRLAKQWINERQEKTFRSTKEGSFLSRRISSLAFSLVVGLN
jgi:hypothetical protein